jgi:ADP-ribose pyrophosphatase YjhB (NUDIX family)
VSVVYLAEVDRVAAEAGDDAAAARWFPLARLPRLAFDHREILKLARRRLRSRS